MAWSLFTWNICLFVCLLVSSSSPAKGNHHSRKDTAAEETSKEQQDFLQKRPAKDCKTTRTILVQTDIPRANYCITLVTCHGCEYLISAYKRLRLLFIAPSRISWGRKWEILLSGMSWMCLRCWGGNGAGTRGEQCFPAKLHGVFCFALQCQKGPSHTSPSNLPYNRGSTFPLTADGLCQERGGFKKLLHYWDESLKPNQSSREHFYCFLP